MDDLRLEEVYTQQSNLTLFFGGIHSNTRWWFQTFAYFHPQKIGGFQMIQFDVIYIYTLWIQVASLNALRVQFRG